MKKHNIKQCLDFSEPLAGIVNVSDYIKYKFLNCFNCFQVNIMKFLRTPFLMEHLRWLLLKILQSKFKMFPQSRFKKVSQSRFKKFPQSRFQKLPHSRFKKVPHSRSKKIPHSRYKKVPHSKSKKIPHSRFKKVPHSTSKKFLQSSFKKAVHSKNLCKNKNLLN